MNYDFSNLPVDLILNILNIVILFVIVRTLVYKPVKNFMDARTQRVMQTEQQALEREEKARELSVQLEDKLAHAQQSAEELLTQAQEKAKSEGETILAQAYQKAQSIVEDAHAKADAERQMILDSLQNEITNSAALMAEKILQRSVSDQDTRKIAQDFFPLEQLTVACDEKIGNYDCAGCHRGNLSIYFQRAL